MAKAHQPTPEDIERKFIQLALGRQAIAQQEAAQLGYGGATHPKTPEIKATITALESELETLCSDRGIEPTEIIEQIKQKHSLKGSSPNQEICRLASGGYMRLGNPASN
jgi:hypothetical protein